MDSDVLLCCRSMHKSAARGKGARLRTLLYVQVLECMDEMDAQEPNWGITYFSYDWFSATRRAVARDFRYDTFITVYMSDCDYYPRVRQKYRAVNANSVCQQTPSVHDMKGHMRLPLDDYDKTKQALAGV